MQKEMETGEYGVLAMDRLLDVSGDCARPQLRLRCLKSRRSNLRYTISIFADPGLLELPSIEFIARRPSFDQNSTETDSVLCRCLEF